MTYFSAFAGVGGFERALEGHTCIGFSETDRFALAVYRHNFPTHPPYGDITTLDPASLPPFDLLVGGFPCQDLSIAGKRAGLAGARSGLFFDLLRILDAARPPWILLENVPGLLSSNGGRDMGTVLGEMAQRGYGVAYRVLDAQHAGVPQRRRRVFIVGHFGDARAGEVLALTESLPGHPPASGKARQAAAADAEGGTGGAVAVECRHTRLAGSVAGTLQSKSSGGYSLNYTTGVVLPIHDKATRHQGGGDGRSDDGAQNGLGVGKDGDPMNTLSPGARHAVAVGGDIAHTLRAEGADASEDGTGRGTPIIATFPRGKNAGSFTRAAPTVTTGFGDGNVAVAFAENQRAEVTEKPVMDSLKTGGGKPGASYPAVREGMTVRRLTPIECERLMSWPDDWTRWGVDENGKTFELSDAQRYRLCGNGVVSACVRAIVARLTHLHGIGARSCGPKLGDAPINLRAARAHVVQRTKHLATP